MINMKKTANERLPQWLFLAIIIVIATLLRFTSLSFEYNHPDEIIAVEVSRHILSNATLDTNWINVNLPGFFKNNQYNFSGYLLASSGFLFISSKLAFLSGFTELELLRGFSATFGVVTVFMTFLLGRQLFGACAGLVGAFFVSVSPLLYQDSLYARPETLFTALTLLYIHLLWKNDWTDFKRLSLSAFVIGILIATKISALALIPLIFIPATVQPDKNSLIKQGITQFPHFLAIALPAGVAGFFIAAPFALPNFDKYLDGYHFLSHQYNSGHWPHGLPDANFLERLNNTARYFISTNGPLLFVSAAIGVFLSARRGMTREALFFALVTAYSLRFGSYPTFFERNFSHIFPVYCLFSAYGLTSISRLLLRKKSESAIAASFLTALTIYPALVTTYNIRFIELTGEQSRSRDLFRERIEHAWGLESMRPAGPVTDIASFKTLISDKCGPSLIELPLFGDAPSSLALRALVQTDGYTEVGRFTSVFENTPPSTLHTYFTPTTVFIFKDAGISDCPPDAPIHVRKQNTGNVLPGGVTHMDPAWTPGGAYGQPSDPFGSRNYLGSWSGADENIGQLRIELDASGLDYFVIPYISGPVSTRQSLIISKRDSGTIIFSMQPSQADTGWKYLLIRVPPGAGHLVIEAVDQGSAWGEWLAVSHPRSYKSLMPPAPPEHIIEEKSR